jgi:hypothetical protein
MSSRNQPVSPEWLADHKPVDELEAQFREARARPVETGAR